jgi:hypothetical protein
VDAEHHAGGEKRHFQEGAEQGCGRPRARLAGNGGEQEFTLGIVVIDARQRDRAIKLKAEAVAAFNVIERRNVKLLGRANLLAIAQGRAISVVQQVAVATTEGIVDLGQHGHQRATAIAAEPEADRIEDIAQHPRKTLQRDFSIIRQTTLTQLPLYPRQQGTAIARAMILRAEAEQIAAVNRKIWQFANSGCRTDN